MKFCLISHSETPPPKYIKNAPDSWLYAWVATRDGHDLAKYEEYQQTHYKHPAYLDWDFAGTEAKRAVLRELVWPSNVGVRSAFLIAHDLLGLMATYADENGLKSVSIPLTGPYARPDDRLVILSVKSQELALGFLYPRILADVLPHAVVTFADDVHADMSIVKAKELDDDFLFDHLLTPEHLSEWLGIERSIVDQSVSCLRRTPEEDYGHDPFVAIRPDVGPKWLETLRGTVRDYGFKVCEEELTNETVERWINKPPSVRS